MTDRELLEKAAKAAGYKLRWGEKFIVGDDEVDCTDMPYVFSGHPDEADWYWNPLTDDGDALRLAVNLGIQVTPGTYNKDEFTAFKAAGGEAHEFRSYQQDEFAATRRAIVRAAAAIGESL